MVISKAEPCELRIGGRCIGNLGCWFKNVCINLEIEAQSVKSSELRGTWCKIIQNSERGIKNRGCEILLELWETPAKIMGGMGGKNGIIKRGGRINILSTPDTSNNLIE